MISKTLESKLDKFFFIDDNGTWCAYWKDQLIKTRSKKSGWISLAAAKNAINNELCNSCILDHYSDYPKLLKELQESGLLVFRKVAQ